MNKSRFLRLAGFLLVAEFLFIALIWVSTSNPTTPSFADALPTQMVLPTVPTPIPQDQIVSNVDVQTTAMLPVESADYTAAQNDQSGIVDDSVSPVVASDSVQTLPTTIPSQQVAVIPPAATSNAPTQPLTPPSVPPPAQVAIQFKPGAKPDEINAYIASLGGTVSHQIDSLNTVIVNLPPAQVAQPLPPAALVVSAEPDYFVSAQVDTPPSDPLYTQQWDLPVIGASDAWNTLPSDAPKVIIAVIDSGICADHPDLAGRILPGWDFVDNDAIAQDDYGHGCNIAGIIAANIDDGVGMAGVAPNAVILPMRVLDAQGIGTTSNVAAAIVRAADEGAEVINLSLGGSNPSSLLEKAINYAIEKHITVVAAAGNTGANILYPAAYAPVVAVGSVDANLQRSSFSGYLPQLDTLAPGSDILTTALNQDYATVSGTSFAAAEVSGLVALKLGAGYPLVFDGSVLTFRQQDQVALDPTPIAPIITNEGDEGNLQPLAVIGPVDSRVRVTNTTQTPNAAVVLIQFQQGGNSFICSGSLISSEYVLTAGHCVYSGGSYSTNFVISPGKNLSSLPYGSFGATLTYVPAAWINSNGAGSSNPDFDQDWALLHLNSPVSASVQPFALSSYSDSFLINNIPTYINAGYPGDKCSYTNGTVGYCPSTPYPTGWGGVNGQGNTQWTSSGSIISSWLSTYVMGNQIDTFGGQSGSPLYYNDINQPVAARNIITALLSYGSTPYGNTCYNTPGAQCPPQSSGNFFRRVTPEMLEAMVANGVPFVNPSCYAVNLTVSGSGTVTRSLPRSQGCTAGTYTNGTSFTLSAVAATGWVFSNWIGATGDINGSHTVNGAATITAVFVPQTPPAPGAVLQPGNYDDRNVNVSYSTGWAQYNGNGPTSNTLSYTNVQNALVRFAFKGVELALYRTLDPSRGSMEVCIDSSCQTVNNFSSALVWSFPFRFSGLTDTTHNVTIRNLSSSYIDLDAIQVVGVSTPLLFGLHQENDANITYSGVWFNYSVTDANGGSMTYTNDPNAQINFSFTGQILRLYRGLASNRGAFQICIDGSCQNVSSYDPAVKWNVPVTFSNLGTGTHIVIIRNTSSSYIDLDAVQVMDALDPLLVGMHDDQDGNVSYGANWFTYGGIGPSARSLHYTNIQNAALSFKFTGDGLVLYRTLNPDRGNMEVCIDSSCQTVNSYSSTLVWSAPFTFANLGDATHNVTIRNLSSSFIDLDGVQVLAPVIILTSGLYQQADPNLTYFGSWMSYANTSLSGGSLTFSNDPTAQITFKMNGDALTLYRTRYMDRGPTQVCVDSACRTLNNNTPDLQLSIPYTLDNLGAGVHTITIRNMSSQYMDLDAIRVGTTGTLNPGNYDDRDTRIAYNGLWYTYNGAGPLNSTISYNNIPGDEIHFNVVGDAFRIYRTMAVNRGNMNVCIDTQPCVLVSNFSAAAQWGTPVLFGDLGAGTHTVIIRNAGSGSTLYIDLDSIEVLLNTPASAVIQPLTETPTDVPTTPSPTGTALIETPTEIVTETSTPQPIEKMLPSVTPTDSPTTEVPTATATPTDIPTETALPSATPTTEVPTATPVPTETPTSESG